MAGWIGLLKHVPWREVVSNAPKLAEGAKSLWGAVAKKIQPGEAASQTTDADAAPVPLADRITTLESQQRELQAQLANSAELIRSLAEQNAQLIARLDLLRNRQRWLAGGLLLTVIAAGLSMLQSS